MFDSVKYNLTNPAFTEDIGEAKLNKMFASNSNSISSAYIDDFDGLSLPYQLPNDKVEIKSKNKKKHSVLKTILVIAGLAVVGGLALKYGKKIFTPVLNGVKNVFSKIKTKIKK